jgi:hypothetical protein
MQRSTLPWWLHSFPGSLQANFHLCHRRWTPTPCLMSSVFWISLNAMSHGVCICLSLVSRSYIYIYIYIRCNNLFIRISLWKQNLFICALAAAVAFKNNLLAKKCTSWDDGATAGNSFENRFSKYLAVKSLYVGCQECQQIYVPSGLFFNFGKSQTLQGSKSDE